MFNSDVFCIGCHTILKTKWFKPFLAILALFLLRRTIDSVKNTTMVPINKNKERYETPLVLVLSDFEKIYTV